LTQEFVVTGDDVDDIVFGVEPAAGDRGARGL